jgi:signal transduction histidine kinase
MTGFASERPRPTDDIAVRRKLLIDGLLVRGFLTAVLAILVGTLGAFGFIDGRWAAKATVVILISMSTNGIYWWMGRRRGFPIGDFVYHRIVDILLNTAAIHYLGGIDLPYAVLAYSVLVIFAAVNESRSMAMWLATLSLACFVTVVLLEGYGWIPRATGIWEHSLTPFAQVFSIVASFAFVYALAWTGGTLGDQLKATNAGLREASARIAQQNRDLERRVAQRTAELTRATQEIKDIVYIVTHDLKNVAVAATETARQLSQREADRLSDRGREYASHLLEDGRTLSRMLEDLLRVFQQSDAEGEERTWVDVAATVREVLRRLRHRIEAKGIDVRVGPLPTVFAEAAKIRHIFENLIDNATKYVGDTTPPRVEIEGERRGDMVRFVVRDNGIGLEERQRVRVFQIYHRAPQQEVAGEYQEGHGIGLAVVKRIVERYGGEIGVRSEPGVGSEFWVALPRGEGEPA